MGEALCERLWGSVIQKIRTDAEKRDAKMLLECQGQKMSIVPWHGTAFNIWK